MRLDWDKLRVFHAVAEAGSFTHAGEVLNLSQSAVSRQIGALEESLKTPLFHRHARGLILTEQGELLFSAARGAADEIAKAEKLISESKGEAGGPLRVTATVAFGSVWLTPRMSAFIERYPDIDVTLVLADTEVDLGMRQADVAIRLAPPRQPDLIQRHLMTMSYHVYASKAYLEQHGTPKTAKDLDDHRIVVYGDEANPPTANMNWLLWEGVEGGTPREPVLRVNSIYGIYRAVLSGVGIGALPNYMNDGTLSLVEILPEARGPYVDMFFVYPEELRKSARVTAFRDFLVENLATIEP
ncbi:MAG: LysR family transcriptional regulator [Rhodospirillales bacterium]